MSTTIQPVSPPSPQNESGTQAVAGTTSDGDLLRRFHRSGDEAAFAQLVARHTPMVFSVCVSVLRNRADAEDAFQAAFFVLARRSRSIQQRQDISAWLHKVALRCALTVRRRKTPESACLPPADELPKHELEKISTRASMTLLHEQLDLLPARYRAPLILYHMQGATRKETRARLNLTEAALKSRLERGKRMLRRRLTQAGFVALGVAVLMRTASSASAQAISPALQQSTVAVALQVKQAWAAAITPSAGANTAIPIAQGVQQTMMMSSLLKSAVVAVLGFGIGLAAIAPLSQASAAVGVNSQDQVALLQDQNAESTDAEVELAMQAEIAEQKPRANKAEFVERLQTPEVTWLDFVQRNQEVELPVFFDRVRPQDDERFMYRDAWEEKYRLPRANRQDFEFEVEVPAALSVGELQARIQQLQKELQIYRRLFELEQENARLRALLKTSDRD